jgi:hypothetical protein
MVTHAMGVDPGLQQTDHARLLVVAGAPVQQLFSVTSADQTESVVADSIYVAARKPLHADVASAGTKQNNTLVPMLSLFIGMLDALNIV